MIHNQGNVTVKGHSVTMGTETADCLRSGSHAIFQMHGFRSLRNVYRLSYDFNYEFILNAVSSDRENTFVTVQFGSGNIIVSCYMI